LGFLNKAKERISESLNKLAERKQISDAKAALDRISFNTSYDIAKMQILPLRLFPKS
jgi:3-hydroxyacyl-CoA dehydrogenase, NAD binding domain.